MNMVVSHGFPMVFQLKMVVSHAFSYGFSVAWVFCPTSQARLVDAVASDDSDVLVFGARGWEEYWQTSFGDVVDM